MNRLLPAQKFPEIEVGLVGGTSWRLSDNAPDFMLMIDVYRGLHCPRCRRHLEAVSAASDDFKAAGLEVLALSTDPKERAEQARSDWEIPNLPLGYGLPIETARQLGCYLSRSIKDSETDSFAEPGIFFVSADLSLYGAVLNSFPFARPPVADLIEVAKVVNERSYPPRGTLVA